MKEFVGASKAYGGRLVTEVLDGVPLTFLPLPILNVSVCPRLLPRCIFQRLGAPVGYDGPNREEDPAHAKTDKF